MILVVHFSRLVFLKLLDKKVNACATIVVGGGDGGGVVAVGGVGLLLLIVVGVVAGVVVGVICLLLRRLCTMFLEGGRVVVPPVWSTPALVLFSKLIRDDLSLADVSRPSP